MRFDWVDIFRPERIVPKWSFEHAASRRFSRLLKTIAITFQPGRLWRSMKIAAPVRISRLILFAIIMGIASYLITSATAWTIDRSFVTLGGGGYNALESVLHALVWPMRATGTTGSDYSPIRGGAAAVILWCLVIPLPFLILGQSFNIAKCRRVHLLRAWVHFLPVPALITAVSALFWTTFVVWATLSASFPYVLYQLVFWSYLVIPLVFMWIVRWWYVFVRDYLKLDHPRAVAILMILTSFLLALVAVISIPGNGLSADLAHVIMRFGF